jgi:hypothetical protein
MVQVAENAASTESDTPFVALAFQCLKFYCGYLTASIELVNESHFPLEPFLAAAFAVRFVEDAAPTWWACCSRPPPLASPLPWQR